MSIRVYIMPAIEILPNTWHPKYLYSPSVGGLINTITYPDMTGEVHCAFQCKRFCAVDNTQRLVFADVTPAQHTSISSNSDVISFPANLNNQVGINLTVTKTALNNLGFPAKKLLATHTWKQVIKGLINHSESLKVLNADNIRDFVANNLNTLLVDLPQNVKDKVTNYLAKHNISVTLTASMTVEDLLQALADKVNVIHKVYGDQY